jgi:DNA polymerase III delta prime subunit
MLSKDEHFLWVEKYRPQTVQDTILPDDVKAQFQQFVDQDNIPNLLLSGTAGVGKTTVAKAMLEQIGCNYIVINGSLNRGIDAVRNDIAGFASTMSFVGGRKYVIIDEADNLTPDAQKSLRAFMEEFAKNCGFILTCNYINKIIPALQSRCSCVNFAINKKQAAKLATKFFKRVCEILENEKVSYDNKVVAAIVQRHFPDWRRVLNELQRFGSGGSIDSSALAVSTSDIPGLVRLIKDKNFTEARHWVKENLDSDPGALMRAFYDNSLELLSPAYVPAMVILVAKYQYQASFSADPEINIMAFLAEVMVEIEFK